MIYDRKARFEQKDQVVKVGEGRVDLKLAILVDCWVAKWVNILLDIIYFKPVYV